MKIILYWKAFRLLVKWGPAALQTIDDECDNRMAIKELHRDNVVWFEDRRICAQAQRNAEYWCEYNKIRYKDTLSQFMKRQKIRIGHIRDGED